MKLYSYFRSSASYRVRIALALKGIEVDYAAIHLVKNEQLGDAFRAVSPSQLVPALVVDEGGDAEGTSVLTQSLAIIEYLDETHPEPPLLPKDALGRARVRAIALDMACEIHPLDNLRVLRYLVKELGVSEDDKNRWYRHWVETGLAVVEQQLAGHPSTGRFCHGDAPRLGRLRAGAADLQRPAHGVPARACADRDARVRALHGRSRLLVDAAVGVPGRRVSRPASWLAPAWAGDEVGALMSTRQGGVSEGPYASMNLGIAVGDVADRVALNRERFAAACGAAPVYLRQVHGTRVVRLGASDAAPGAPVHEADASVTTEPGLACVVQAADCLPVLFAAPEGRAVGAAHAGWRGLAAGVLEAAVDAVCSASGCPPGDVRAWLGACIGPRRFEVGADVLQAFDVERSPRDTRSFKALRPGKWLADLPGLARARLAAAGVVAIDDVDACTVEGASRVLLVSPRRRYRPHGRRGLDLWRRPSQRRWLRPPRRGDAHGAAPACRRGTGRSPAAARRRAGT